MSKEIFFFASRGDMLQGLKNVEQAREIKYVKCGAYDSQDYIIINSADKFENLGINVSGNHQSESYLVLETSTPIMPREVKQSCGGVKYFIDQLENKTSIVFWPSGLYESNYLICGHVATISDDSISKELYRYFIKNLVKGYKKIGNYYIGIEAMEMAKGVRFITINVNQPEEYDLKLHRT